MRYGADVDELDALGRQMAACADTIEDVLGRLSTELAGTRWSGPDADGFRRAWNGPVRADLLQSSHGLRDAGQEIARHVHDQREVSRATTAGPAGSGSGPASTMLATGEPPVPWLQPRPRGQPWQPLLDDNASATVAVAGSLGGGVAAWDGGAGEASHPVGEVLDGATAMLGDTGPGTEPMGVRASALLAGQPPGRYALQPWAPTSSGGLAGGIVATQPLGSPEAGLVGWGAVSPADGGPAPVTADYPAGTATPSWDLLERGSGRLDAPDGVVGDLW